MAKQMIGIQVTAELNEDELELDGWMVDDYDPKDKTAFLVVPLADIDTEYSLNGGMYPDEFWGSIVMVEEIEITVHRCQWEGRDILNADDVAWEYEQWMRD